VGDRSADAALVGDVIQPPIDIFFSHAKQDHEWAAGLCNVTHQLTTQLLGRATRIWIYELVWNAAVEVAATAALRSARAFVPVLSPSYVSSEWCLMDIRSFCEARRSAGRASSAAERIVPAIRSPIRRELVPAELSGARAYHFYAEDSSNGHVNGFELGRGEAGQRFLERAGELAAAIAERIETAEAR
jgi:hypothetical protein